MKKSFFFFLILFSFIFSLGCLNTKSSTGLEATESVVTKGNINASVTVNGKETNSFDLLSRQSAIVRLEIRNADTKEMRNVQAKVFGFEYENHAETDEMNFFESVKSNNVENFEWIIKAPTLGENERLQLPVIMRVCYEQTTGGQADLVIVPEGESVEEFGTVFSEPQSAVGIEFQLAPITIIEEDAETTGNIIIRNKAEGWVDYFDYADELSIYKLKEINFDLKTVNDGLKITALNGFPLEGTGVNLNNLVSWSQDKGSSEQQPESQHITINSGDTFYDFGDGSKNYGYFLKLVNGKELKTRLDFDITDTGLYDEVDSVLLKVNATYGYCVDIATVTANLRGR